jgi:hypothetical protein
MWAAPGCRSGPRPAGRWSLSGVVDLEPTARGGGDGLQVAGIGADDEVAAPRKR